MKLALLLLVLCFLAPPDEPLFQFGLLADIQYADKDSAGSRHYRESLSCLEACVDDLAGRPLVFAVQLGDLIDGRGSDAESLADLDQVLDRYQRLPFPGHHVIGNHCLALPRATLLPRLGMKAAYYAFSRDGWRFVVLDSLDVSLCGRQASEPEYREARAWLDSHPVAEHLNAQTWNGGLGEQQFDWLRGQLVEARRLGEKVVLFSHLPVAAASPHHLLWNHAAVVDLLVDAGGVVAFFAGHDHAGGYKSEHGIHFVTLAGMVESTRSGNAYAVVQVFRDRLVVQGVGRVPDRVLCSAAAGDGPRDRRR